MNVGRIPKEVFDKEVTGLKKSHRDVPAMTSWDSFSARIMPTLSSAAMQIAGEGALNFALKAIFPDLASSDAFRGNIASNLRHPMTNVMSSAWPEVLEPVQYLPLVYFEVRNKYNEHIESLPKADRVIIDLIDDDIKKKQENYYKGSRSNDKDADQFDEWIQKLGFILSVPQERKSLIFQEPAKKQEQSRNIEQTVSYLDKDTQEEISTFCKRAKVVSMQSSENRKNQEFRLPRPLMHLYGPPGVGKTTLAKNIARGMGYNDSEIIHLSVNDIVYWDGSGAENSSKFEKFCKTGINNPVFILDEVDKQLNTSSWKKDDNMSAVLNFTHPSDPFRFGGPPINYMDFSGCPTILMSNDKPTHAALNSRARPTYVAGPTDKTRTDVAMKYYDNVIDSMEALKSLSNDDQSTLDETCRELLPFLISEDKKHNPGMREMNSAVTDLVTSVFFHLESGKDISEISKDDLKRNITKWTGSSSSKETSQNKPQALTLSEEEADLVIGQLKSKVIEQRRKIRTIKKDAGISVHSSDYGTESRPETSFFSAETEEKPIPRRSSTPDLLARCEMDIASRLEEKEAERWSEFCSLPPSEQKEKLEARRDRDPDGTMWEGGNNTLERLRLKALNLPTAPRGTYYEKKPVKPVEQEKAVFSR